jgi:hypothetical protein
LPLGRSHAALLSFNAGPSCSPVHNIAPQIQELPALAPNIRPCPPNYKAITLHPSTQHRTPDARVAGSCTQRTTLPTKLQSVHPAPNTRNRTPDTRVAGSCTQHTTPPTKIQSDPTLPSRKTKAEQRDCQSHSPAT